MNASELIVSLGNRLGIGELALSPEGTCSVIFDQDEVAFEVNSDRLFLIADIGPATGREDMYNALLRANHLGNGSAFGNLGLDWERDVFCLSKVIEADETEELFENQLALFVKTLRYWKEYLQNGPEAAEQEQASAIQDPARMA
ncbi:MAG: type III secretion system chaperone [Succinivibrio sp.]|nr:type III secretion system chaperone [Succinivibrio sp.]